MRFFKDILVIVVCLAFFALIWTGWQAMELHKATTAITNYDECAAKYPILETYPTQCRTPDGRTFVGPETSGPVMMP